MTWRSGMRSSSLTSDGRLSRSLYVGTTTSGRSADSAARRSIDPQGRDLLGHQADEEHDHGEQDQEHRPIRNAAVDRGGVGAVERTEHEGAGAERDEDTQRTE